MNKKYFILLPLLCFVLYVTLTSSSGGINGVSVSGCSCHGAASSNTLVSITGLPAGGYTNGTVYPITVSVTNTVIVSGGAAGLGDGFNMTTTSGAFTAVAGTALNGTTEIRHTARKVPVAGTATWTFNWTAPATGNSNVSFFVAGNATNGNNGTSGDQWNQTSTSIIKNGQALAVTAGLNPITCNGGTATISATGVGGVPPYTYQRNSAAFQASNIFTNNSAGTYTITVKDANNATSSTVATLAQPSVIVPAASASAIACNGGTSTITASATGGTGAYNYRLNTGTFQASPTFAGNLASTYTVTVRDANLCTRTTTINITQPTLLAFTVPTITPPACNGGTGSISVTANNGTGTKTYTISPLGPQSNTTGSFTGLTAQPYTITVADANNCTRSTTATMTQPTTINFNSPTIVQPSCSTNGTINITASGGIGAMNYTINPLGPQSNSTGAFTGLTPQTYTVTAKDANNCTKTSVITLNTPLCNSILNITAFIEGFMDPNGTSMVPAMFVGGVANTNNTDVDDITVNLHNSGFPYSIIATTTARLKTNGTAICTFPPLSGSYYISIVSRNALKTWSANLVTVGNSPSNYAFHQNSSDAFGSNQVFIGSVWAFYSGDIDQDGSLSNADFSIWETDANDFASGYLITDIDGDAAATNADFSIWEANTNNFVSVVEP